MELVTYSIAIASILPSSSALQTLDNFTLFLLIALINLIEIVLYSNSSAENISKSLSLIILLHRASTILLQ